MDDLKYKRLKERLNKAQNSQNKESSWVDKEYMQIKRTRAGIIMPQRNAFDFVEKPRAQQQDFADEVRDGEKGKDTKKHFKKIMMGMKRSKRATFTNKRMQIVKMDL